MQLLQHALAHAGAPGRRHREPHLLLDDSRCQSRRSELYAIHVIRARRRAIVGAEVVLAQAQVVPQRVAPDDRQRVLELVVAAVPLLAAASVRSSGTARPA